MIMDSYDVWVGKTQQDSDLSAYDFLINLKHKQTSAVISPAIITVTVEKEVESPAAV